MQKLQKLRTRLAPAVCLQLIVITHGYRQDQEFPQWVPDMAQAMNQNFPQPDDPDKVAQSIVNFRSRTNPDGSIRFILYDWADWSRKPGAAINGLVTSRLYQEVAQRVRKIAKTNAGQRVDVHFIGHSRGCYVNHSVLRQLSQPPTRLKLGCVHVTTLDPQGWDDGEITSNPGGIVDWAENFFQKTGSDAITEGDPIKGALNVDLTEIVKSWNGRADKKFPGINNHSEVHDWYHWLQDWDDYASQLNRRLQLYNDGAIQEQARQLARELTDKNNHLATRLNLYANRPHINRFELPAFSTLRLFGSANTYDRELELTSSDVWQHGSAFTSGGYQGDLIVQFKFKMEDKNSFAGADGLTFALTDAKQTKKLGDNGGSLGYGGLSGLAIAFDTYQNHEHGDAAKPELQTSIRYGGSSHWENLDQIAALPEELNSGNWFSARISLSASRRLMSVRLYSHGKDDTVLIRHGLKQDFDLPLVRSIGFTAATGTGGQRHLIDDVLIYVDPKHLDDLDPAPAPTPRPLPPGVRPFALSREN